MGRFGGIKDAKMSLGGVYFLPGNYLVRVDAVKTGETRKKDEFFVVECTVLFSDNPERKKGSSVSWMTLNSFDSYLGHIKHFISVAQELEPDEVDEAGVEMVVSDDNPCMGIILRVQAVNVLTRAKTDFTKVTFRWPEPEDFVSIGYNADGTPKKAAEQKSA
jgi:hypothetical protein